MKISYAILTHNEGEYVERLLTHLVECKRPEDEIVVLDDYSSDPLTRAILEEHEAMETIRLARHELGGDFAAQKNRLTDLCEGDVIFQIDADEIPSRMLIEHLPALVEGNPTCEVFLVPRVNTVEGLTDEHIRRWGWTVDEAGRVNWPDYQWRIYRNQETIRWANRVHERLVGFAHYGFVPPMEEMALIHAKEILRQESQNAFYDTLG